MKERLFEGVRVIELAEWTFVPAAGAVLAEFGADVIKVERRDGLDYNLTEEGGPGSVKPRPGVGDRIAAMNLVAGVAGALFSRARTGEGGVLEVSLPGSAMSQSAGDIVYSKALGVE